MQKEQKNKDTLASRLAVYTAVAGAAMLTAPAAEAAVVYIDVDPDVSVGANGNYNVDLNNDGIIDVVLNQSNSTSTNTSTSYTNSTTYTNIYTYNLWNGVNAIGQNGADLVGTGSSSNRLASGASIGPSATSWNTSQLLRGIYYSTSSYGSWDDDQPHSLGVRFSIGGQTHYGWVRLTVNSDASGFTVHDFAYENTPNRAIQAGDMVGNSQPTDITLSANSVEENLSIGTVVGTLSAVDVDAGDSHTFTLVAGTGDSGNASFAIAPDNVTLVTDAVLDFEIQDSYSVRVQADDGNGNLFEKALTIDVTNDISRITRSGGGGGCSIIRENHDGSLGSKILDMLVFFLPLTIFGIRIKRFGGKPPDPSASE